MNVTFRLFSDETKTTLLTEETFVGLYSNKDGERLINWVMRLEAYREWDGYVEGCYVEYEYDDNLVGNS